MQGNAHLLHTSTYKLYACYDRSGQRCGCHQPLKQPPRASKTNDGTQLYAPQCKAHGHGAQQGVTQVVDSLRAMGVQHQIALEWPCKAMPAGKCLGRNSKGRFTKRPDAFVDIVLLDSQQVVLRGLEINGREHDSRQGRNNDKRKEHTTGFDVMFETAERATKFAALTASRFYRGAPLG